MPRHSKKFRKRTLLNLNINNWINECKKVSPRKKLWFSLPKGDPTYVFWRKWSCWAWKEHFQWCSFMWWRSTHSCSVYLQSLFLYEVGLTEVKENDFQDTPHDKRRKNWSIRNPLTKKCEKDKMKWQALQKMANILF